MAVVAARAGQKRGLRSEYRIELGILNNMPDAALERTEQQFFALLAAAAQDLLVRVRFFSLSTIPRDSLGREHLKRHAYASAAEIPDWNPDALIVTGTEPRAPDPRLEPYWSELAHTRLHSTTTASNAGALPKSVSASSTMWCRAAKP